MHITGMFTLGGNELPWFGVTLSMIYQINIAISATQKLTYINVGSIDVIVITVSIAINGPQCNTMIIICTVRMVRAAILHICHSWLKITMRVISYGLLTCDNLAESIPVVVVNIPSNLYGVTTLSCWQGLN